MSGERDRNIAHIIKSGFKTIFSNHDRTYLDCGYGNLYGGMVSDNLILNFILKPKPIGRP